MTEDDAVSAQAQRLLARFASEINEHVSKAKAEGLAPHEILVAVSASGVAAIPIGDSDLMADLGFSEPRPGVLLAFVELEDGSTEVVEQEVDE